MIKSCSMKRFLPIIPPLITTLVVSMYLILIIFKPGYIYFRDVTESLTSENLYKKYFYTYNDDIGETLAEKARLPIFYAIFSVFSFGKSIGIFDNSYFVKVKILFLFVLSLIAFIYTTYKILKLVFKEGNCNFILSTTSTLGGLYYISNYWFSNRITHFGLFFSTVTIPITFYFIYKYLFSEKTTFKTLIPLIIGLTIFTATPHTILFELVIGLVLYETFVTDKNIEKNIKLKKTFQLAVASILYFLTNLYWILPFVSSLSKPDAVLSETIVNTIGENASLINSIRLMGYWLTNPRSYFVGVTSLLQQCLSFVPIILTIITLVIIRKNRSLFLPILLALLLGIFLSTSSLITNVFYFFMMFKSPFKSFGWILREYDKFGIILTYVYSFSLSIALYKATKSKFFNIPVILLFIILLSSNIYFLNKTTWENYYPRNIPNEFLKVSEFLEKDTEEFNTIWYPGVPKPTWAEKEDVRFTFSNIVSPKPTITTRSELINYVEYLFKEENIYSIDLGKALDLIGVKYLIIRRDYLMYLENNYDEKVRIQTSLEKVLETELLTVYRNKEFNGLVKFYSQSVESDLGLNTLKTISNSSYPNNLLVNFSDKPDLNNMGISTQYLNKDFPINYAINLFNSKFIYPYDYITQKYDGNAGPWKIGSLENITHAETNFFFSDIGIIVNQFDYGHGVIISKSGFKKDNKSKPARAEITQDFSKYPNVAYKIGALEYSPPEQILGGMWNIVRSSKFEVSDIKVMEINLRSNINKDLIPHFKIQFYDLNGKTTKVEALYPNTENMVDVLVEVPNNAKLADFSIWTSSEKEGYEIKNFHITDVTDNVAPTDMYFVTKSPCENKCTIYLRTLKSIIGGEIGLKVNEEKFNISTIKPSELRHNERYEWVEVGETNLEDNKVNIGIINKKGFNSINAIVFLDEKEKVQLINEMQRVSEYENTGLSNPNSPFIKVTQVNPTKYVVSVYNSAEIKGILSFAKPFNKNWIMQGQRPSIANGYINGWELDSVKNQTYLIEYRPQKYFYIGAIISITTILSLLTYYLPSTKEVTASDLKSNSQG